MRAGRYAGALWLEGSPTIEDAVYWLCLVVDTTMPLVASGAHRDRGTVSAYGDGNILDAIEFIVSKVWADDRVRNRLGGVMVQDEVVYSGREVQKGRCASRLIPGHRCPRRHPRLDDSRTVRHLCANAQTHVELGCSDRRAAGVR